MSERIVEQQQPWNVEELLLPHALGRSYYVYPEPRRQEVDRRYADNSSFWVDILRETISAERTISLMGFNVFEWIPRNPGLYHTERAAWARTEAQDLVRAITTTEYSRAAMNLDAPPDHAASFRRATSTGRKARELIYTPQGKLSMLQGGVGCIRLRPIELKTGSVYWFMAATSTSAPDEGIPLLVPDALFQQMIDDIRRNGSLPCDIVGKTKFISKELSDLYATRYGIQRLYVEVLEALPVKREPIPGEVSVAASFLSDYEGEAKIYASYVTFDPGYEGARQNAARWMQEEYVEGLYKGSILTDFDQQAPALSDSLFSLDQVLSSPDLAQEIATLREKYGSFNWSMLETATFSYHTHQERIMVKTVITGDNTRFNQAIGAGASATQKEIKGSSVVSGISLTELASELAQLQTALSSLPELPERDVIKGAVGKAEMAASHGDRESTGGALKELKPFGSKILEIAQNIGIDVAVAAIKGAIGI